MKKLKLIILAGSLLMLTACSHPEEENSVPAETSAPETAVSEVQTLPAEVVAEISASETLPEPEMQTSETVPETETVPAETDTIPAETSGNTETVMTETLPEQPETSAEETVPETEEPPVNPEEEISETAFVNPFQNTCWAGIEENRSEQGLLFGSDAVKVIRIDGNSELSEKEYQYSADAGFLYWKCDGEEAVTKSWVLSEDNTQLTLTDTASGETIAFYAVDGSTEEEVIAVMDALALMQ